MAKKIVRRRKKSQYQIPIIILVALLCIGLVGSAIAGVVSVLPEMFKSTPGATTVDNNNQQIAALEKAVKDNPKDMTKVYDLGNAYFDKAAKLMQTQDPAANVTFDKAIEQYKKVIAAQKNNKNAYGDMATAYFYTNRTDLAIESVKKALAIDPNYTQALTNYGIYLGMGKKDYKGAIEQLKKVKSPPADSGQVDEAKKWIDEFEAAAKKPQPTMPPQTNK